MKEFPKDIKFKYTWRKYQQRVLDELQEHIDDDHLHVIAPPGSGKTVLGLEVAIRLNKPTLILAPTLAIRNQWIQRFCELFLQSTVTPDWISRDIRNPKFMTVVTYQGLHAACNNWNLLDDELDEEDNSDMNNERATNLHLDKIVRGLKAQHIKTIVVDEAHHLKNEWWHTLSVIKEELNPSIVGLTATPPYDVSAIEWQRYSSLNGPVDTEISIPELVLEGDLCPHQDFIHFTYPTLKEEKGIAALRNNINKAFLELKADQTIVQAIEHHPVWQEPNLHQEWIHNNLSYYCAFLIFIKANNREITQENLEVIGDINFQIPNLDYKWLETVLNFYLYKEKEHFQSFEEHQALIENKLRRYGLTEKGQVSLSNNTKVTKFLTSSMSKLQGIKEIVDFEYGKLGNALRLVILSDFIRKEYFSNTTVNDLELDKIGVIPIFEKLRRENHENKKIAVLTGSMIIIPATALALFEEKAKKLGITTISANPVPFDNNYVLINQNEKLKHDIVQLVTQIFQLGEIEVLVGTKSLLGEGWDAPAINALILASFVGSFVLSNQMRGRAIRTQIGNKNKTSNIWHLVCIDPTSATSGDDYEILKRRFRSFVGVSFKSEPSIENGIDRMNLPFNIQGKEVAEKKNREMFSVAADRACLKQRWEEALVTGISLVEEIKMPFAEEREYELVKSLYYKKTLKNLWITLGLGVVAFGFDGLRALGKLARFVVHKPQDMYTYLTLLGAVGILFYGRQAYVASKMYIKYRDISKDIQQIGEALLKSLIRAGAIQTKRSQLKVKSSVDRWGAVYCHLDGGNTFDKSTFTNALLEILTPINNPRYIIVRMSRLMVYIKQKDYHAVPEILGRNKNLAKFFQCQWTEFVGSCSLIYTRSTEGKKLLLKSRLNSLAAQLDDKVEHVNKWR